ncbi:uncharacterized protein LOC131177952 [Hevea brasiliensis]|uniref:uncharacterized protein LOC131177952 n=1 Tax=Hevea brasiliensis TaxID=3981 RepID=UPI0025D2132A|nr:uncharacterized protein LOC131177952 [Hevea brasiliensis]
MGFKDLNLFNVALLAKQAWRVINTPQALWVQVLKGIYYPHSNFLNARNCKSGSWGWRNLLEGREALKAGLRWQISGPSFMNVSSEPWIPTLPAFKVSSSRPNDSPIIYIADLIDVNSNQWNLHLLQTSFSEQDWKEIIKIPLAVNPREPKRVWHYTSNVVPTVRSVYFWLKKWHHEASRQSSPSSSRLVNPQFWKKLWSLPLPPKDFSSFTDWWQHLFDILYSRDCRQFILAGLLCWNIWKARNAALYESIKPNHLFLITKAQNAVDELLSLATQQHHSEHIPADGRRAPFKWQPPPFPVLKCNVDASFVNYSVITGYGVIVRNHVGQFVDGCAASFTCGSPLVAEGIALRAALQFAISRKYNQVIFEVDSLFLVNMLISPFTTIPWKIEGVIHDIKVFWTSYSNWSVKHVHRCVNECDNLIAKAVRQGLLYPGWILNPRDKLPYALLKDRLCDYNNDMALLKYIVSQDKAKTLGISFIPLEATLRDTFESLKEKGFLSI